MPMTFTIYEISGIIKKVYEQPSRMQIAADLLHEVGVKPDDLDGIENISSADPIFLMGVRETLKNLNGE